MKLSIFPTASALAIAISTPLSAETACSAIMMHGSITQLSDTHATVDTSVLINATSAEVWATLTNFDAMTSWGSLDAAIVNACLHGVEEIVLEL